MNKDFYEHRMSFRSFSTISPVFHKSGFFLLSPSFSVCFPQGCGKLFCFL